MFSLQILTFYPSREVARLEWTCFASTQVLYIASSSNFEEAYLCALSYNNPVNRVEIFDSCQMEDKEKEQQLRLKNMSISDEDM